MGSSMISVKRGEALLWQIDEIEDARRVFACVGRLRRDRARTAWIAAGRLFLFRVGRAKRQAASPSIPCPCDPCDPWLEPESVLARRFRLPLVLPGQSVRDGRPR